jgi:hypothetical protein
MHTFRIFLLFKHHILLWVRQAVGRPNTIINFTDRVWVSLEAHRLARHDPLANTGWTDTVLICAGPSRAQAGPARPAHLDIYRNPWPCMHK